MQTKRLLLSFCLTALSLSVRPAAGNNPRERIYLHTDKQTYLSGEILRLKAFLSDEKGKPASLSKVAYIELHDGASPAVQIKIALHNGAGQGWMELPVALPTGYYSLTAYTRYMRNEGEKVFFRKTLAILNPFRADRAIAVEPALRDSPPPPVSAPSVSVIPGRKAYATRSQGEIRIQGLPARVHSLSLSIAGKGLEAVRQGTDIIQWHNQLSGLSQTALHTGFLPEYEGHIVQGRIVDAQTGEPAAEEVVSFLAFPGDQVRLFGGQAGADGSVAYYTTRIEGMHEAATLVPPGASGKNYRVDLQSPFAPLSGTRLPPFRLDPAWEEELLKRSVALQTLYLYTPGPANETDTAGAAFLWPPARTYLLDEYTRFPAMEEVIGEFVLGLGIRRERGKRYLSVLHEERIGRALAGSSAYSLVLLDGLPVWDHDFICNYDPLLVRKIDIYRGIYFFGGQYFDGIVFFATYNHSYPGWKSGETAQIADYEGTQALRFFRYPSYESEADRKSPVPDFRHTLLWMPEVEHGGNSSVAIPFTTSDYTGEFQITLEGLTSDGEPVFGTASFEVK
jgi:hypothetical protein